jgi:serine/threonine protein kinase/tetratricopeptide (TPR) repeat protein
VLAPGKLFGNRYQIIEEIGMGGMGRVYKVRDITINETMVLKLIHPEIAFRKHTVERFRNELRLARRISHRNVCRVFDLHEADDALFITMEYVAGEDLKRSIRRIGPFTMGKTLSIAKQVCDGLREAHRLGILHRDLKSKNVIIDLDGNARIMDFGIASSFETKGLTDEGVAIGTPTYMSPEQAMGKGVDQRSDIYSLGIILYEMVTGDVPFKGDTALSIAMQHKEDAPRNPMDLNPRIPRSLNRLILKCLEKKKERRHQSAGELMGDLLAVEEEISTEERAATYGPSRSTVLLTQLRSFKVPGYIFLFFIAAWLLFYVVGKNRDRGGSGPLEADRFEFISSMAVFPFTYSGSNISEEYLCVDIMTRIISRLNKLYPRLRITPQLTAEHYARKGLSPSTLSGILDINYLLWGNVASREDAIVVDVELIDVEKNVSAWRDEFLCLKQDIFNEPAGMICREIGSRLGLDAAEVQIVDRQPDPDAYILFLKARYDERAYHRDEDEAAFQRAKDFYERALLLDPECAMFHWGVGNLYEIRYVKTNDSSDLENMLTSFHMAYDLDPDSALTNLGLGWAYFHKGDNDLAYTYFKQAYVIDPLEFEVNYHIAHFFRSLGLYEKALKYYEWAQIINPSEKSLHTAAVYPFGTTYRLRLRCLIYLGRNAEAIASMEEALRHDPENLTLILLITRQYIRMRILNDAEKMLNRAVAIAPENEQIPYVEALLKAALGDKAGALALVSKGFPPEAGYLKADLYCLLGMKEEAIDCIQEGIAESFKLIKTHLFPYLYLKNNTYFSVLEQEPRYREILSVQKALYDRMLEKYKGL